MIHIGIHSYKYLLRYGLREEKNTMQIAHFQGDLSFDPWGPNSWKQSKPYRVPKFQILMVSDN